MKKLVLKISVFVVLAVVAATLCANNRSFSLEYYYDSYGVLAGKAVNGQRVSYRYDVHGQLLAVTDENGNELEHYTYDPAGNRLSKTVKGKTTTYAYDEANQLISETTDGVTKHYAYDAAGRMTRAGDKTYHYDGRGKLLEVHQNGQTMATFEYDIDGQLSKAIYGDRTEEFVWDGLALVWRSGVAFVNEPAATGGNPVLAGDEVLFNDMLGNSLSIGEESVEMTAFGETENNAVFFTGKPFVDELGYSFLFRNYSPEQGKWTSSDPMGYPDGWNNLAYVNNYILECFDFLGAWTLVYDSGYPPIPSNIISETTWITSPNHSALGIYSITTFSWNQIALTGGTNGPISLTLGYAHTTNYSEILNFSESVEQSITRTANDKGILYGVAEFSAGIASAVEGTCSAGYNYQYGQSTTVSIALDYHANPGKDEYAEIYAYQLVAQTVYYAKYIPPTLPSAPTIIQNLGDFASFTANLVGFGERQKLYTKGE